jgi:hypothetical protein
MAVPTKEETHGAIRAGFGKPGVTFSQLVGHFRAHAEKEWRRIDGQLQSLRRAGVIRFDKSARAWFPADGGD